MEIKINWFVLFLGLMLITGTIESGSDLPRKMSSHTTNDVAIENKYTMDKHPIHADGFDDDFGKGIDSHHFYGFAKRPGSGK